LLISGDDVDKVVALVRRPVVRKSLELLFKMYPNVVVDERAVQLHFDFMPVSTAELDHIVEALTAFAAAVEVAVAEETGVPLPEPVFRESEAPVRTPMSGGLGMAMRSPASVPAAATQTAVSEPIDLATNERLRRIADALKGLRNKTVREQQVITQELRIPRYRFKLEVRSIGEPVKRMGSPLELYLVKGLLVDSQWRLELYVPTDQANTVLSLMSGDIIRGECLLDDVRSSANTAEATTAHLIEFVSKGVPLHPDVIR
jgi:hypothetical protein